MILADSFRFRDPYSRMICHGCNCLKVGSKSTEQVRNNAMLKECQPNYCDYVIVEC